MDAYLLGKKVLIDKSPLLLSTKPGPGWEKDWEALSGTWYEKEGYLHGVEPENKGGILLTKAHFSEDVFIKCKITAHLPATRDLNVAYCAQWDEERDYLKSAYIAGVNGWYRHKCGVERFPENGLHASTPLYQYTPGQELTLISGAINGHLFLMVDGQLILEMIDQNPITTGGRAGFSAYCTHLKIRDIEIRKALWEPLAESYEPEF